VNKKPTKRDPNPLYPQHVSITLTDIQKHRRLHNYLIQYWRKNKRELDFPQGVNLILQYLPHLCFVPCFLLAYTCCRVGELKQVCISDLKNRKPILIKSSKSKHIRHVEPLSVFKPDLLESILPSTMICVVSYDHLKNAIRCAKKRANLHPIENILDLTHLFRHLTATYLHRKGVEIEVISNKLGHLNKETTFKYIH